MMKKSYLFLVLVLSLFIVSATGTFARNTVTLRFWTTHIYGPELETAMNKLIDQWNKQNPSIKVIQENIPGGQVQAKLTTAAQSNTLADIVDGWSYQALQLAQMDQVLPLDDLYARWTKTGEINDFVSPSIYKKFYWKGHYWGMPWALDLRVITYRKDLLQQKGIKVPASWTDFRNAVLAANDPKNGVYGLTYAAGFNNFTGQIFMPFMIQAGGGILNEKGELAFGTESYEANMKALEFLTSFATKDKVTPPGIGGYDWDDSDAIFLSGKAAFSMERGNVITRIMREHPDLDPKIGILPALQGPKLKAAGGMCNPLYIWKNTKSPAAAKKFVLWLTKNERVLALYQANPGQMWPVKKSAYKDKFFQNNHLLKDVVDGSIPHIIDFAYPASGVPEMGIIDGEKMFSAPVNDVITGTKTPEEAIKAAEQKMQAVFKK